MNWSVKLIALGVACSTLAPLSLRAEDVARVGSESISREEFEAKAQIEEAGLKRKLSKDERLALLRSIANQRLLVAEARRQKLDRSPEHKLLMAETERKALADRIYQAEVLSKAQVSLDDAKQYYQQNPSAFDEARVSQIVVSDEAKAQALKLSLSKAPKTFAAVAKAQSEDPQSKPHGGDLGALHRGMLMPDLEKAVFSAKPGSVVGPVKTQYGYHLLYLKSLKRLSWDEAGASLQQDMQKAKAQQLQQGLLEQLGKKDKVTVFEDKL